MKLNYEGIKSSEYINKGYIMPNFDIEKVRKNTIKNPTWVHFGAGNIFRAFPAVLCQKLLEKGSIDTGITVIEGYDEEIIQKAFTAYDNLALAVSLKSDGSVEKHVVASVCEALGYSGNIKRIEEIFTADTLKQVTLTITEKGYSIQNPDGSPKSFCKQDFESMENPISLMAIIAKLLYVRFKAGKKPIAMVSLDNCSHNGTLFKNAISALIDAWIKKDLVEKEFKEYINNEKLVSFTWSMIDKITPRPADTVVEMLKEDGFEDAVPTVTSKNTYISAMVNAEECEYLAIEDKFPNGKLPLDEVGVIYSDRETVDKIEKMKVCTCLNPLHTCMSIFGCLLGHTKISEEMKDETIVRLIKQIGYIEGMPVVVDPIVMNVRKFIDEVVYKRLPNPFVPDTPQRIVCDTSKKISVRFGETLKAYIAKGENDLSFLTFIPLVFAGYLRYLTAVDDKGITFEQSPDPNIKELSAQMNGFEIGSVLETGSVKKLLHNEELFGVDLYKYNLATKVLGMFNEMSCEKGSIRITLNKYLDEYSKEIK